MNRQVVMMDGFSIDKCWFNLETNGVNKPRHGLWTSTLKDNPADIGWIEWAYYNMPKKIQNELYMLIPKPSANVYEIDSIDDYLSDELVKLPGDMFIKYYIDYLGMRKKGYDGIHFTERAAALGHSFGFDDVLTWNVSLALNSIDCESTVWFNTDWISSVGRITNTLKKDLELFMEGKYDY
jgi:hypothetical protein